MINNKHSILINSNIIDEIQELFYTHKISNDIIYFDLYIEKGNYNAIANDSNYNKPNIVITLPSNIEDSLSNDLEKEQFILYFKNLLIHEYSHLLGFNERGAKYIQNILCFDLNQDSNFLKRMYKHSSYTFKDVYKDPIFNLTHLKKTLNESHYHTTLEMFQHHKVNLNKMLDFLIDNFNINIEDTLYSFEQFIDFSGKRKGIYISEYIENLKPINNIKDNTLYQHKSLYEKDKISGTFIKLLNDFLKENHFNEMERELFFIFYIEQNYHSISTSKYYYSELKEMFYDSINLDILEIKNIYIDTNEMDMDFNL